MLQQLSWACCEREWMVATWLERKVTLLGRMLAFFRLHNLFISEQEIVFEKEKTDTTMMNMRETQLFYSTKWDFHKVPSTLRSTGRESFMVEGYLEIGVKRCAWSVKVNFSVGCVWRNFVSCITFRYLLLLNPSLEPLVVKLVKSTFCECWKLKKYLPLFEQLCKLNSFGLEIKI